MDIKNKLITAHLNPNQVATIKLMHQALSSVEFYQLNQVLETHDCVPASEIIESFAPVVQNEISRSNYQTANVTTDQIATLKAEIDRQNSDVYYFYEDTYQLDQPEPLTVDDIISIVGS